MGIMLVLAGALHLATPLLTTLFCYFALTKLSFGRQKWLGITLLVLLVAASFFGFYMFAKWAYMEVPKIAQSTLIAAVEFAEKRGVELPVTDSASFKAMVLDTVKSKLAGVGAYARRAAVEVVMFFIGVVVACSLFLGERHPRVPAGGDEGDNLYTVTFREIMERFSSFYLSFSKVMGAQIIISAINTGFTFVFLLATNYKHIPEIVAFTFLCGLLPIIGNLVSNTLILAMGLSASPQTAMFALVFLIALHKTEYFLNSKIVGHRIQNPMWLTLLGLVLGEKLMGVPGMILAPAVLHYVKVEMSKNKIGAPVATPAQIATDSKVG